LGPGGEVLGDQRDLQRDGVVLEAVEREVGQAGLLGDADAVLGAGAGEVQALKLDRVAVEADRAVGALADAVADGVGKVVAALGTVWVKIGTPQVATQPGSSEPSPAVAFMQSQLWWFMAAAAILAVIIGGARMAWEQRAQPGRELLKGLLTLVVVSGCGLAVISLAMAGTDEFSRSVIDASLQDGSFAKNLGRMLGFSSAASGGVPAWADQASVLVRSGSRVRTRKPASPPSTASRVVQGRPRQDPQSGGDRRKLP
jgi:hypothetical protein